MFWDPEQCPVISSAMYLRGSFLNPIDSTLDFRSVIGFNILFNVANWPAFSLAHTQDSSCAFRRFKSRVEAVTFILAIWNNGFSEIWRLSGLFPISPSKTSRRWTLIIFCHNNVHCDGWALCLLFLCRCSMASHLSVDVSMPRPASKISRPCRESFLSLSGSVFKFAGVCSITKWHHRVGKLSNCIENALHDVLYWRICGISIVISFCTNCRSKINKWKKIPSHILV